MIAIAAGRGPVRPTRSRPVRPAPFEGRPTAMSTRKVTAKVRLAQPDVVDRWDDGSGACHPAVEGRTGLPGPLSRVTWFERAYFLAVGALAAAVGLPTYFSPANAA